VDADQTELFFLNRNGCKHPNKASIMSQEYKLQGGPKKISKYKQAPKITEETPGNSEKCDQVPVGFLPRFPPERRDLDADKPPHHRGRTTWG
jgi:hypothetical protein